MVGQSLLTVNQAKTKSSRRHLPTSQGVIDDKAWNSSWYMVSEDAAEARAGLRNAPDGQFCICRNPTDKSLTLYYSLSNTIVSRPLVETPSSVGTEV